MRRFRLPVLAAAVALSACAAEVKVPRADAGASQRVPVGYVVQLDGSASSDPGGLPLSFGWAFRSLPAGSAAALNDAHVGNPSFVADVAGDYVVELVVTNGTRRSEPASVAVTADASVGAVLPVSGFSVASIYAGPHHYMSAPRGVSVGAGGDIYVAQGGATSAQRRITRHAGGVSSIVAQAGYFASSAPQDLVWDSSVSPNRLLVSQGTSRIVAVTPAGEQSQLVEAGGGASFFGLALVTLADGAPAIYAADQGNDQVQVFDPATGVPGAPVAFGGNLANPWGVGGVVSGGANAVVGASQGNSDVWRQVGASAPTQVSQGGGLLSSPRGLALTRTCPTPKWIVASRATGTILVLDDCSTAGCASGPGQKALLVGLGNPVGVAVDGTGSTASLLVTDETLNALFRVTGDLCSL